MPGDHALHRFPLLVATKVAEQYLESGVGRGVCADMRCQPDVGMVPERMIGRRRLVLKHVDNGITQLPT
nr:hypothetical protein [Tanacetum cinerariifolium]